MRVVVGRKQGMVPIEEGYGEESALPESKSGIFDE
jgi:hypothetical protein